MESGVEQATEPAPGAAAVAPEQRAVGVQSVDRALDVLEALAARDVPMGVSDLALSTGLAYGTLHRLLRTLVARGYVRQDASRKYAVGPAVARLSAAGTRSLAAPVRPYLARLVEVSGETSNFAVLEGDFVVYVAQVPSNHKLRMFAEVGRRVLPHCTAVGKVLLAQLPVDVVDALVARTGLPRRTERTITDPVAFHAELASVRERGFAVDDGEEEVGVRCLAVPVADRGRVVGAFSVSGPADRMLDGRRAAILAGMGEVADSFAREVLAARG
ncbi:MAG: IclR family transcriptional regulator [Motilibacteraceae bacterium]